MTQTEEKVTHGIKTLLGDPKRAIIKISVPMMIGMLVQAIYNLTDAVWVSGLGADALASIGLFFPFFMILISIGSGISIGGSSAVSRKIGMRDKISADNVAIHSILLGVVIGLVISLPFIPFLKNIFLLMIRSEPIALMSSSYGKVLFGGAVFIMLNNIFNGILRGEGDSKRAMYAMILGSGLNIILDPIFIYVFGLGVVGAAWATIISIMISTSLFSYWLFIKRDSYIDITLREFKADFEIIKEILSVGIPASLSQLSMSFSMLFLNMVIVMAGGTDGVAVFTSGWRIVMFGIIPLLGMAAGVTAVTGAAYGARDKEKLNISYLYAIKIGFLIELFIAVFVFIFAREITFIFTYSKEASRIADDLTTFLRYISPYYPTVPLGMLTSAMFQGIGKGFRSLVVTILRTLIVQVPVAYILGVTFNMGLKGVWLGIFIGNLIAVTVAFLWGRYTVHSIKFSSIKG